MRSESPKNLTPGASTLDGGKPQPVAADMKRARKTASFGVRSAGEPSALMKLIDKYFGTWIQFLREVKTELLKVTWPSRKETVATTIVVIVFVLVISIFLGVIDIGLSSLVRLII